MKTPRFKILLRLLGILLLPFAGLLFFFSFAEAETKAMDVAIPTLFCGLLLLAASVYLLFGAPHLIRAVGRFPQIESKLDAGQAFTQTGGIRYGRSFWFATNCTMPFAQLRISKEVLVLSVSFLRLWQRTFIFQRSSVHRLKWKRALFSLGLQIEHDVTEFPPFILFWVSNREELTHGLREFGYEVSVV
jgi:hypothetical protein